jgi:hypothetical protein
MASNQYAEPINTLKKASQILADLRQVKLFHLDVTAADESYWGYRGMDAEQLKCSESRIDSGVAKALFEEADGFDEVSFGTSGRGWCFQIGDMYVWLAPVRARHQATLPPITNPSQDDLDKL